MISGPEEKRRDAPRLSGSVGSEGARLLSSLWPEEIIQSSHRGRGVKQRIDEGPASQRMRRAHSQRVRFQLCSCASHCAKSL